MTDEEFRALYTALQPIVYKYAARRLGAERAKDVVGETFAVAWEKRDEYPTDPSAWPAWTVGIARNKLLQDIQRQERKHHDHRFAHDWVSPATEPSIEDSANIAVASATGQAIFAALTPAEQDLFGIAFLRELTPIDGSSVLGIKVTAYTTRVARLRQRLRDLEREANATDDGAAKVAP